jgi:hypothetical protein
MTPGMFVQGAWVQTPVPKYTVTAIAEWTVSAENPEQAYKIAATLVPENCSEWEADQRFKVTRICPKCKATNYRYNGIQSFSACGTNAAFCSFCQKWKCNECGHEFHDRNCEKIEEPEI